MATAPTALATLSDLETLATSHKYLILDFWAEWCPPCKAIAPLFTKLAAEYTIPNKLAFAKVDVDEAPEIAAKFQVSAMPTFLFLVDGEPNGIDGTGVVASGGVVAGPGGEGLQMIRGADPRNLVAAVSGVAELAKKELGESGEVSC
ncbi:thioredoxin-domain-containing protein [Parathielavia hyrcaniae]|uniref:Thioredoxin-domain-containing protein n=1 Tax=Parathielavia hyrcaniae TaxID=113614 RepID=A0AAN6SZU6_9PEZI|nr:thioredoxin-domain-containing protein [Parathielavia hyrcaniae]